MIAAIAPGVLGLIIGSFVNVVVYRVPAGASIVSPPSACPQCGHAIRARDNIPILSWLLLRGKCRDCAAPISWRYPLVELGTALLFVAAAVRFAAPLLNATTAQDAIAEGLVLLAMLYFAAISVALSLIDIDTHRLPNSIVLPAYLVAGALFTASSILAGDYSALLRAAIGMAALFAAYFAMAMVYPGGMGFGDVKLAGVIGIYLGWVGWGALAVGALSAFLLAGVFAAALMLTGRANRKSGIPFGPWMLVGAWVGILVGTVAFEAYLSLFGLSAA